METSTVIRKNLIPLRLFVVIFIAALLSACASGPRIVTNSDPAADWTQFRTFGFFQPLGTDMYTIRSITSNQLIESATREMEMAGFTFSESNPDLLINFVISTRETIQTRPSTSASMHHGRSRYRTWSGWSVHGSTAEVVQRTEGTLGVDVVDRVRNQLVWEGAASQRVTDSTRQNQAEVLDAAITSVFANFP
jgi:hypothetical protein